MALQLRRRFLLLPRCYSRRVTTTPLPPPPPTSTPMLHFGSQGYLRNFMPYSPLGPSQMRGVAARNDSARQMSSGISSHLAPQLKSSAFFNTGLSGNYSFLGLRAADTCGIALESNSIGSARSFSTTCGKQVRFLIANKSSVGNPNLKMEQESAAHSLFHRSERRQSTSAASGAITDEASTSTSKSCTDTKKDSGRRNSGADDKLQVSADATEKKASTKKKRRFFKTNKAPSKSADGRIKSETGSKKEVIADTEENKLLRDTNGRFGKTSKAASKSGEKSSVNQQENKADTSKSKQDAETPKLKKTMNRSRRSSKAKKSGSATAPAEKPSVNQQENNADTSKSQKGSDTSKVKKTVNRSRRSSEAKKTAGATAPAEKRSVNQQENNAAISKSQKGADTSEVKKTVNKPNISVKAKKSAAAAATAPAVDGSGSETKPLMPLYPPTSKSVVVVESATKANVIQKYLGGMYEVIPSHGHVRDLAARSRSVRPEDDFSMVWEVPPAAWTHLKRIRVALRGAENLILASDPDREGEAIAWHLKEMLEQQGAIKKDCHVTVARVVFHEITEDAIKKALMSPRYIDMDLVNAYLARRSLDYLIGFGISPLIWKKLPGCQSAGRVQSAALALVCDQEAEIEQFIAQEYWTIDTEFKTQCPDSSNGLCLTSRIKHLKSNKLDQLSISSHEDARAVENMIYTSPFEVVEIKRSKVHKNPPMPFITSSLQQDAANKLHFTAGHTMKVAQKLYEGITLSSEEATGLITYMRTDGFHISDGAAEDIRSLVKERYGLEYASEDVQKYSKKVINAQEAHEAIRPTSIRRLPSSLVGILDEDSLKLYTLIWKRTMACQMEDSRTELVQVDIGNPERDITFHSAASRFDFKGYEAVYEDTEACLSNENSEGEAVHNANFEALSKLEVKDLVSPVNMHLAQHFTKPPSRYSEGALIKKLEELGIGRPSTYAFVMRVLQDRKYVMIKNRFLHPEFRGRMVSAFLSQHFSEIANYSFTANMETELDNVSAGSTEWKGLLKGFWERFDKYCRNATRLDVKKVERMLEEKFRSFLFPDLDRDSVCPSCSQGTLRFRVSKFGEGYFVACDKHPKCKYVARTFSDEDEDDDTETSDKILTSFHPRLLGAMPDSDENVFLKQGPYGYYVQIGDDRKGMVQKRAPLSGVKDIDSVTIEDAIELLQYPKLLGKHPDDDIPVVLAHSKAGFTIRHRRTVAPLPRSADLKKITLERAVKLLTGKNVKIFGRPKGKVDKDAEPFEWH